ncbi:hypothetical protein MPH_10235 [Macrophomina phaseolina MS6]|uniref:Uncharacterized protein n=1 Tax=Macrophomina phaseolina (strain MS6) TaxID=1126212 RepID=K2QRZ3_MACPH|nr:hypothetical protein MPH_10235 [Macrophomina phaseolina MS6]
MKTWASPPGNSTVQIIPVHVPRLTVRDPVSWQAAKPLRAANMLCRTCLSAFSALPEIYEGPHHESEANIRRAAEAGCKICYRLLAACERKGAWKWSENTNPKTPMHFDLFYMSEGPYHDRLYFYYATIYLENFLILPSTLFPDLDRGGEEQQQQQQQCDPQNLSYPWSACQV